MISFSVSWAFFFSWKCGRFVHKYLSGLARRLGIFQGFQQFNLVCVRKYIHWIYTVQCTEYRFYINQSLKMHMLIDPIPIHFFFSSNNAKQVKRLKVIHCHLYMCFHHEAFSIRLRLSRSSYGDGLRFLRLPPSGRYRSPPRSRLRSRSRPPLRSRRRGE